MKLLTIINLSNKMIINKLLNSLIFYFFLFGLTGCIKLGKTQLFSIKKENQGLEQINPLPTRVDPTIPLRPCMKKEISEWRRFTTGMIDFCKKTSWNFLKNQITKKCLNYSHSIMRYKGNSSFIPENNSLYDSSDRMAQHFLSCLSTAASPCYDAFVSERVDHYMKLFYGLLSDPNFYDSLTNTTTTDFRGINLEAAEEFVYKTYRNMPEKIISRYIASNLASIVKLFIHKYVSDKYIDDYCLTSDFIDHKTIDLIINYAWSVILIIADFGFKETIKQTTKQETKKIIKYFSSPDSIDNLTKLGKNISNLGGNFASKCRSSIATAYYSTFDKGWNGLKFIIPDLRDVTNNTLSKSRLWKKSPFIQTFTPFFYHKNINF